MLTDLTTADECREAFNRSCHTLARIDTNEPGARIANQRRRAGVLAYLDRVLDTYLEAQEIETL